MSSHLIRHILDLLVLRLGHVTKVGKDDKPWEEAGERVDGGGYEAVAVAVVVELVVARIGEMHPEPSPNTERERETSVEEYKKSNFLKIEIDK